MPKISEERRAERRAQILDAALRCWTARGYRATSMADIITESGLSAGAIYGYFPSKELLVRAVAVRVLGERRADLEGAGDALSPAEVVKVLASGVRTAGPLPVLIQMWGEATVDDAMRPLMQEALAELRAAIARSLTGWARANPSKIPAATVDSWAADGALILTSMLPGFILQSTLLDDFDVERYVRALPAVLLT